MVNPVIFLRNLFVCVSDWPCHCARLSGCIGLPNAYKYGEPKENSAAHDPDQIREIKPATDAGALIVFGELDFGHGRLNEGRWLLLSRLIVQTGIGLTFQPGSRVFIKGMKRLIGHYASGSPYQLGPASLGPPFH